MGFFVHQLRSGGAVSRAFAGASLATIVKPIDKEESPSHMEVRAANWADISAVGRRGDDRRRIGRSAQSVQRIPAQWVESFAGGVWRPAHAVTARKAHQSETKHLYVWSSSMEK